jgi:hypothetical protein
VLRLDDVAAELGGAIIRNDGLDLVATNSVDGAPGAREALVELLRSVTRGNNDRHKGRWHA